jgi:hypothetical protein
MFYMKLNNTSPALQVTLKDANGTPVDLTGASVRFHMRAVGATTAKVDAAAALVTAASGIVKYAWIAGDTDTAGRYEAEFEVTFGDSSVETFPNRGFIPVMVGAVIA